MEFKIEENLNQNGNMQKIYERYKEQYPDIVDYSDSEIEVIKDYLKSFIYMIRVNKHGYLHKIEKDFPTPKSYLYGGITNDLRKNLSRHQIDKYIKCIFVADSDTAKELERYLGELGLDIGREGLKSAGNGGKAEGGDDDSRVVYIADKTLPGFCEIIYLSFESM